MPIPDTDSISTYGGALNDYSPVIDPTTDRPASGMNAALASVAGMTHTAVRAWAKILTAGTSNPTLVASDAVFAAANYVVPTLTRYDVGIYIVTWGATVSDEIGSGSPGYVNPHTLALRAAWATPEASGSLYHARATVTSANIITLYVYNASGTASDSSGVNINIYAI